MHPLLKLTEGSSLALHAVAFIAGNPKKTHSASEMAEFFCASQAHLAKVLQRLVRAGILKSSRGPKGGFVLSVPREELSLLDVYEAIEGKLDVSECFFNEPVCRGKQCIFGDLVKRLNREIETYLKTTTFNSDTTTSLGGSHE